MSPKIFPSVTMALNFIAAICYAWKGDFPRSIYWICAGMLTLTVTWWMR